MKKSKAPAHIAPAVFADEESDSEPRKIIAYQEAMHVPFRCAENTYSVRVKLPIPRKVTMESGSWKFVPNGGFGGKPERDRSSFSKGEPLPVARQKNSRKPHNLSLAHSHASLPIRKRTLARRTSRSSRRINPNAFMRK